MSRLNTITVILISFLTVLTWSEVMAAPPFQGGVNSGGPFIRLQYATFDPIQKIPAIPQSLSQQNYAGAGGPYIVQFQGSVKAEWKDAVVAAGGQIDSYLPDYAYIVKMDAEARTQVEHLDFVRWIGIFQPAYKMPPGLTASPIDRYRVRLAGWANGGQVRNQLSSLGGNVRGDGTSLVINAQFDRITQIAQLPDVLWIEEFQFFEKHNDIAAGIMNAATSWGAGYTGNGQMVTIADSGLDTGVDNPTVNDDIHRDFDNRVAQISSWPVVPDPDCITNGGADDGAADVDSGHGTHVAGSAGGNGARSSGQYRGIAHQSTLTFQAIEQFTDWEGVCGLVFGDGYYLTGIPDDLNDLFQEAYNWGARIHTNSWGAPADGAYTTVSGQADEFTWNNKDFTLHFSAGNAGVDDNANGYVDEDSINSPATAKNVITIGASENNRSSGGYNFPGGLCWTYGNCWPSDFPAAPTNPDPLSDNPDEVAAFSSRGPTDDGRIKPDLIAPGTNILSTRSSLATGNLWGAGPSSFYVYSGGTSMATPLAAGASAVVRDYLVDGEGDTNPSSALVQQFPVWKNRKEKI